MEDLRLVGLSEDGARLVMEASNDDKFGLPIDERVHAALRGDRARLGQLQISIESQLRPREIQARIRAGQTAEQVAAAAGVSLDRIRRFEGPILAERNYVAETAQTIGVRRVTDSVTTPLGTLIRARLDENGIDPDTQQWDSWKVDERRWQVQLVFVVNDEQVRAATWIFDPARRILEPADDEARWLVDEESAPPAAVAAPPRLTAVRTAPEPVRAADAQPMAGDAAEATDTADYEPGVVIEPSAIVELIELDDHPKASPGGRDEATPEPIAPRRARSAPSAASGRRPAREPELGTKTGTRLPAQPPEADEDEKTDAQPEASPATGRGRSRRAAVPSWDEILFGAGIPPARPERDR